MLIFAKTFAIEKNQLFIEKDSFFHFYTVKSPIFPEYNDVIIFTKNALRQKLQTNILG